MRDLASHIIDLIQNSIRAQANTIGVSFTESNQQNELKIVVSDDGVGMAAKEMVNATDPFFTTRISRKVGLGLSLMQMSCEQTGGLFSLRLNTTKGLQVEAIYKTDNPDCLPLGDLSGTMSLLFFTNPNINFEFSYSINDSSFEVSSKLLQQKEINTNIPNMSSALSKYIETNLNEIFATRDKRSYLC